MTTESATIRLGASATIAAALALTLAVTAPVARLLAQGGMSEEHGTLPDGTVYRMQVPPNWNKVLLRDLDSASTDIGEQPAWAARYRQLLDSGFAIAGTARHPLRMFRYDPAREIANLEAVLDRFQARFGKPARVIQYGCSGGGHIALATSEDFPGRIDGVIALAAQTPVWIMNTSLDGWFVLKALIAPDLAIANLTPDQVAGPLPAAWRRAIDTAQQTPAGRARIALAFTIGQWPAWVNQLTSQPDLHDPHALEHAMYHTVFQNAGQPGGQSRIMFENAAHGQQPSWNTGIDYREFFENGNEAFRAAVRELYREAGLDLDGDLAKVNAFPRVASSAYALDFWKQPGRTVRGTPKIPVLRLHEVGDWAVPPSLMDGYEELVRANTKDDLVRTAYVNGAGHCEFNAAESAAAVSVMMRRLDSGTWPATDPESLNRMAASLVPGVAPRFFSFTPYRQTRYNRTWLPQ